MMTTVLLALLAVQAKALPEAISSKHYDLKTSATREQGQELLDFMELVHQTYTSLLKPENPSEVDKRKFTIHLYKDMQEYMAAGAPPGSGAYYDPRTGLLVGWYDDTFMRPFFAHEGMHQFTDATSKNFKDFPMWFTEGIADCIGNCEVKDKKLYMCVKSGMIARMRLQLIQAAVQQNATVPLERLFALDKRTFMANASLCYAQSWSFCHFLMTFPKEEDRSVQIPDGKYRKHLAGYYEQMRKGGITHREAWEAAFKGIPLAQIEAEWKKYVMSLDGGKYIGIRGEEVPDAEADQLPVDPGYTGIKLVEVLPDGVAGKAGMKAGDVVLQFDGRRFPRHDAMNRLRVWMQDVPYGRAIKVVVLREGAKVEVSCKWDPPPPSKK
jgi:hypothetical protein